MQLGQPLSGSANWSLTSVERWLPWFVGYVTHLLLLVLAPDSRRKWRGVPFLRSHFGGSLKY